MHPSLSLSLIASAVSTLCNPLVRLGRTPDVFLRTTTGQPHQGPHVPASKHSGV